MQLDLDNLSVISIIIPVDVIPIIRAYQKDMLNRGLSAAGKAENARKAVVMKLRNTRIILSVIVLFSLISIAGAQDGPSERLARAIDELISVFDSDGWISWKVPNVARDALIAIGPPAIPSLFSSMDHQNPRVQEWCGATLEGIAAKYGGDSEAKISVPENTMIEAMKSKTYGENARRLAITLAVRLNGADALQPISELLSDDVLKIDAVEALGMIGDSSAVSSLDRAYDETNDTRLREAILQALGNIGGASAIPILARATADDSPSIRRTAISILGIVGTVDEIPLLIKSAQDEVPEIGEAAMYALYAMAGRFVQGGEKERGIELYKTIFDSVDNLQIAQTVADKLGKLGVEVDLAGKFGFIDTWMVIGPFENKDGGGFDTVYPPEEEIELTKTYQSMGQEVKWREVKADGISVDLLKIFATTENVAAYAMTSITVPEEMDVQIKAGSDDTLTIWLNGEKIHANNVARGVTPDQDVVDARLRKGENTILLKICQGDGGWGYCLRIVDKEGNIVLGD